MNRLALFLNAPIAYGSEWFSRFARTVNTELSRLSAFAGEVVWDPSSLASGTGITQVVAVPGVRADARSCVRVFAPYDLGGVVASAYVSGDDQVTIALSNNTGGVVLFGTGMWGVIVENFVR